MDSFSFSAQPQVAEPDRPAFVERERFVEEYQELLSQLATYMAAAEVISREEDPANQEWVPGSEVADLSLTRDAASAFLSHCESIAAELTLMSGASEVVSDMSAGEISHLAANRISKGMDGTEIADDIITASVDKRSELHGDLIKSWDAFADQVGESRAEAALELAYSSEAEALLNP